MSSLTAPSAEHLQIEILGVSVLLEQIQKPVSEHVGEPMKPSTVGTGVIVWVSVKY